MAGCCCDKVTIGMAVATVVVYIVAITVVVDMVATIRGSDEGMYCICIIGCTDNVVQNPSALLVIHDVISNTPLANFTVITQYIPHFKNMTKKLVK